MPGALRTLARAITSRIRDVPAPLSCASGATVNGPTPTTEERSSRKLLPTMRRRTRPPRSRSRPGRAAWKSGRWQPQGYRSQAETVARGNRIEGVVANSAANLIVMGQSGAHLDTPYLTLRRPAAGTPLARPSSEFRYGSGLRPRP